MPSFLTYWHVLIETARRHQDAGSELGSLITDAALLQRRAIQQPFTSSNAPGGTVWDTGPLPGIGPRFPGSDISAMAYLGALAPDVPNYGQRRLMTKASNMHQAGQSDDSMKENIPWSVLFHSNRSGDIVITLLEQIAAIPAPAIRSQALAFAMGYLSHLATDLAFNPWMNILAMTYRSQYKPGLFKPDSIRAYADVCLDEYIATTYFHHPLHQWGNQPWIHYIEPVASRLLTPAKLSARVLDLLVNAAEAVYGLTEGQKQLCYNDFQAGMQRLRLYLAGRNVYRWHAFRIKIRPRHDDPIIATIAMRQRGKEEVTCEEVREYAIRLSERLCRKAMSYYVSLRSRTATAQERSTRLQALRGDLRNWDLQNGYAIQVMFNQDITLRFDHNWLCFSDLWPAYTRTTINDQTS